LEVFRSAGGDEYAISVAANPAAEQSAHRRSANPQPPAASSGTHWRSWFSTVRNGSKTQSRWCGLTA